MCVTRAQIAMDKWIQSAHGPKDDEQVQHCRKQILDMHMNALEVQKLYLGPEASGIAQCRENIAVRFYFHAIYSMCIFSFFKFGGFFFRLQIAHYKLKEYDEAVKVMLLALGPLRLAYGELCHQYTSIADWAIASTSVPSPEKSCYVPKTDSDLAASHLFKLGVRLLWVRKIYRQGSLIFFCMWAFVGHGTEHCLSGTLLVGFRRMF